MQKFKEYLDGIHKTLEDIGDNDEHRYQFLDMEQAYLSIDIEGAETDEEAAELEALYDHLYTLFPEQG